jgi:hypothetical protein
MRYLGCLHELRLPTATNRAASYRNLMRARALIQEPVRRGAERVPEPWRQSSRRTGLRRRVDGRTVYEAHGTFIPERARIGLGREYAVRLASERAPR